MLHGLLLVVGKERLVFGFLEFGLCLLIGVLVLRTLRNVFEQRDQFGGRLASNGLDVALKDQKVAGFDENANAS